MPNFMALYYLPQGRNKIKWYHQICNSWGPMFGHFINILPSIVLVAFISNLRPGVDGYHNFLITAGSGSHNMSHRGGANWCTWQNCVDFFLPKIGNFYYKTCHNWWSGHWLLIIYLLLLIWKLDYNFLQTLDARFFFKCYLNSKFFINCIKGFPNANWVEKLVYYYSINLLMKKLNMFDYEMEIKMVSLAIIRYLLSSCDQLIGFFN
jgi:hypothetical protein